MRVSHDSAEAMAIQALGYLADDPEQLGRFLALTGLGPETIRQAAAEPGFLAAVLDYVTRDETLLLRFAAHAGLSPALLGCARQRLAGADADGLREG
jgi:hypothetical protein